MCLTYFFIFVNFNYVCWQLSINPSFFTFSLCVYFPLTGCCCNYFQLIVHSFPDFNIWPYVKGTLPYVALTCLKVEHPYYIKCLGYYLAILELILLCFCQHNTSILCWSLLTPIKRDTFDYVTPRKWTL